MRAVASNAQPGFAWHANKHHCTGYLSEGGKIRKLAAHVHRAAMATIDLRTHTHILHRWKASLFLCKTVVRRASCDLQRAAGTRIARARAPLCWLSLGRWQNTQAGCARALCYAGCGWITHYGRTLHRRKVPLVRCKTLVRRASCGLQHAAGFRVAHARDRHCAGCHSGGGEIRKVAARALRAALAVIGVRKYGRLPHWRQASLFQCKIVV